MNGLQRALVVLVVLALILTAPAADAHRMDLTLRVVGAELQGLVTYHGGRPVVGAEVEARAGGGELLATAHTDVGGRFRLLLTRRVALEVLVTTADGHLARQTVAVDALPESLAASPRMAAPEDEADLARRVADTVGAEVARQLAPLQERLEGLERQVRLRDILGGVGYILGLCGLAALILGRRRAGREGETRS